MNDYQEGQLAAQRATLAFVSMQAGICDPEKLSTYLLANPMQKLFTEKYTVGRSEAFIKGFRNFLQEFNDDLACVNSIHFL